MSFWRHYYHLVWATKDREPLIQPEVEKRLRAYIVSKSVEQTVYVYAIGTCLDHIHLVVAIPPKLSVAKVVKRIKGASSHFVNHVLRPPDYFSWQRGYGSMSMGETQLPVAVAYVENQKQHHAEQSVNSWLERYCQEDEGPQVIDRPSGEKVAGMHEEAEGYDVRQSPF